MKSALAILAGVLSLAAAIPYIKDIVAGKTKPNVVSWFTWTLLLVIATSAAFAAHETRTALLTTGDTLGTALTLILGLKYGIARFSWFDALCQAAAILGLILWAAFNSPTIAILAAIIIDVFASLPTIKHAWQKPHEETVVTYAVICAATILTVISLSHFTTDSLAFPVYLFVANGAVVTAAYLSNSYIGRKRSQKVGVK